FSLHSYPAPHHLHSFPTRRSSDLPDGISGRRDGRWGVAVDANVAFHNTSGGRLPFDALKEEEVARLVESSLREHQANGKPILVIDRKSTRLNSSHVSISYAVFCLK